MGVATVGVVTVGVVTVGAVVRGLVMVPHSDVGPGFTVRNVLIINELKLFLVISCKNEIIVNFL